MARGFGGVVHFFGNKCTTNFLPPVGHTSIPHYQFTQKKKKKKQDSKALWESVLSQILLQCRMCNMLKGEAERVGCGLIFLPPHFLIFVFSCNFFSAWWWWQTKAFVKPNGGKSQRLKLWETFNSLFTVWFSYSWEWRTGEVGTETKMVMRKHRNGQGGEIN